jgi:hypothetical protein
VPIEDIYSSAANFVGNLYVGNPELVSPDHFKDPTHVVVSLCHMMVIDMEPAGLSDLGFRV